MLGESVGDFYSLLCFPMKGGFWKPREILLYFEVFIHIFGEGWVEGIDMFYLSNLLVSEKRKGQSYRPQVESCKPWKGKIVKVSREQYVHVFICCCSRAWGHSGRWVPCTCKHSCWPQGQAWGGGQIIRTAPLILRSTPPWSFLLRIFLLQFLFSTANPSSDSVWASGDLVRV